LTERIETETTRSLRFSARRACSYHAKQQ